MIPVTNPSVHPRTFSRLQLTQVFEGGLEAEVEAMAAAQVQEEVTRAERRARVVH